MSSTESITNRNEMEDKQYPAPLASHDDVVRDPKMFEHTLRRFHTAMGTKYMAPIIGGVELNLHVLYVEVTNRGGYNKVVSEKKWREISSLFNFSSTTTSASYALKKNYLSFLYHYEQVYFFKVHGSQLSPTAPMSFEASGTINGKIDCGYLVTVKLGSQTLNGVLYHPKQPSSSMVTKPSADIVPYNPPNGNHSRGRRRSRKRRRRGGDPNRPKPNRSGYNFFFKETHSKLKNLCPEKEREFTRMIADSWNNLKEDEKNVYQGYGAEDKERYQRELKEYKEKLKALQATEANRNGY